MTNDTKVSVVAVAGALTTIVAFVLSAVAGVALPDGVEAAVTTLFIVAVGAVVQSKVNTDESSTVPDDPDA